MLEECFHIEIKVLEVIFMLLGIFSDLKVKIDVFVTGI